jgi:HD superfamily phosphohydrolase
MTRSGRIADPVHGYVTFTPLEAELLGNRISQRLRNVAQTGLAQLVYPEARSSRFAHSLGVMHLSSALLTAAFRNAEVQTRSKLAEAVSAGVMNAIGATVDPDRLFRNLDSGFLNTLQARSFGPTSFQPVVALAEQGLRLAGLFHDLGHLPFSHDFEAALDTYWANLTPTEREVSPIRSLAEPSPGRSAKHETVGHGLALLLFRALAADEFTRAAFDVAYRVLEAQPLPVERPTESPADEALRWLHSLIAGEIDADRCDYVLRDGRNYGFEFATFDLPRLLDNMRAVEVGGKFAMAVEGRGLSAVESFLMARYRSYQLGVRHHKVAQVGVALRHATARQLSDPSSAQLLADIGTVAASVSGIRLTDAEADPVVTRFATYDDVWWMTRLRGAAQEQPGDEWLQLVCWRGRGVVSLWKRTEDLDGLIADIPSWNDGIDRIDAAKWHPLAKSLADRGALIMRHNTFKPWTIGKGQDSELAMVRGDTLEAVSKSSPLIRSLRDAWMQEPHVQAFRTSTSDVRIEDVLSELAAVAKEGA